MDSRCHKLSRSLLSCGVLLSLLTMLASSWAAIPYKPTPHAPADLQFKPYNSPAGFIEQDLWWIEEEYLRRTHPLIAPDFSGYVYGEVLFLPDVRQTFSTLYWVPLPKGPFVRSSMDLTPPTVQHSKDPRTYLSYFDEQAMLQRRSALLKVNQGEPKNFSFETLTPVDWSSNSQRLLFKRRAGLLYTGLRASDVLVWDAKKGSISLYQELTRALAYHFITLGKGQSMNPRIANMAWDVEPLGWKEGSNDVFYWRAWAYTNYPEKTRYPLGLWSYHVGLEESRLLDVDEFRIPSDVAQNGFVPVLNTPHDPSTSPQNYQTTPTGSHTPKTKRPKQRQIFW
jgi:hypothetical protein